MKKEKPIYKTNHFLNTQIPFTLIQKRIVHFLYSEIQKYVYEAAQGKQYDKVELTLFEDVYLHIPTEKLDTSDTQHRNIYTAFKGLKEVDTSTKDECVDSFILKAERKNKNWRVLVSSRTFQYMLKKAKEGVTPLGTIVYMSASSGYTISMYEQLKQRADFVKWYTTPEELAQLVSASTSAQRNYSELKRSILTPAQKELRELYKNKQSDICFDFEEKRGGRGNKIKELTFIIYQQGKGKKQDEESLIEQRTKDYEFIAFTLGKMMVEYGDIPKGMKNKNKAFISKTLSNLMDRNAIQPFARKLEKVIQRAEKKGENPDSKGAVARFILEDEFNIE